MLLSVGLAFIRRVLEDEGPLSFFTEYRLDEKHFTKRERVVIRFVSSHTKKHGALPKPETVERNTNITLPDIPSEPVSYWAEEVRKRKGLRRIQKGVEKLTDHLGRGNLDKSLKELKKLHIHFLSANSTTRVQELRDVASEVITHHDKVQQSPRIVEIPFGLPYIDAITLGAQPGDTTAIVGATQVGKTYFLLSMADTAFSSGKNCLFVTPEMPNLQVVRRQLALRSNVNATRIRMGRLSTHIGRKKLLRDIEYLQTTDNTIWYLPGSALGSIEELQIHILERMPDVCYVDSAYLLRTKLRSQNVWDNIMQSSAQLKRIADQTYIPIIATYQFGKQGGSINKIYGGISIAQNASIVMGISVPQEESTTDWRGIDYRIVDLLKGREGERGKIKVLYDMLSMNIQQEEILSDFRPQGVEIDGQKDD